MRWVDRLRDLWRPAQAPEDQPVAPVQASAADAVASDPTVSEQVLRRRARRKRQGAYTATQINVVS